MSILAALQQDQYRIGLCQAIIYDRRDTSILPESILADIYWKFRGNRYNKRDGTGILETLFCGMTDVSFPAIVSYLSGRPLCVLGVWDDDKFKVAGIQFPTVFIGIGDQKACFAGYGFTREFWGTDEEEVLAMLGIAVLFNEIGVLSVHGVRYSSNDLTAKFMARFGFRDIGVLPHYLLRDNELVDATLSTLPRDVFEKCVERMILEAYRAGK